MTDTRRDVAERLEERLAKALYDEYVAGTRQDPRPGAPWPNSIWHQRAAALLRSEGEPDAWTVRYGEHGQRTLYHSKREATQAANGAKVAGFEDARAVPVYFGTPSDSPTGETAEHLRAILHCGELLQAKRIAREALRASDSPEREPGTSDLREAFLAGWRMAGEWRSSPSGDKAFGEWLAGRGTE